MVQIHTLHPDIHEAGLADGCPGCEEAASDPFRSLDNPAIRDLTTRMLANRWGGEGSPYGENVKPRSHTEAVAMASVLTQFERIGQVAHVVPGMLSVYLKDRWNIDLPGATI